MSSSEKNQGNTLSLWGLFDGDAVASWVPLSRSSELWNTWAVLWTEAYPPSSSLPSAGWSSLPPPPPGDWRTCAACSPYCLVCSRGFKGNHTLTSFSKNFRATVEHNFQLYIPRKHVLPLRFPTSGLPTDLSEMTMRPRGKTQPGLYQLCDLELFFLLL